MNYEEQRTHDFALEIMKLYFNANSDAMVERTNTENVVDTETLFNVYNGAFDYAFECITGESHK